jgi:ribosomal protein L11
MNKLPYANIPSLNISSSARYLDSISIKDLNKYTLIKIKIITGTPLNKQSHLNAALGPYGVNINNLQKLIENRISIFADNIILPIYLKVYGLDKYKIIIKYPNLYFTFGKVIQKELKSCISVNSILSLLAIKVVNAYSNTINIKSLFFIIISSLRSQQISIYYDPKELTDIKHSSA